MVFSNCVLGVVPGIVNRKPVAFIVISSRMQQLNAIVGKTFLNLLLFWPLNSGINIYASSNQEA
jgi:hypothetical protein